MAEPYLGTISLFSFNFTPENWLPCDGRTLSIGQNQALYSLMGTRFGGDGKLTFALPNLQGRTPVSVNNAFGSGADGYAYGSPTVTLKTPDLPAGGHIHQMQVNPDAATSKNLPANLLAVADMNAYAPPSGQTPIIPQIASMISSTGGGQPHNNMQPFLALGFYIAVKGLYPPSGY